MCEVCLLLPDGTGTATGRTLSWEQDGKDNNFSGENAVSAVKNVWEGTHTLSRSVAFTRDSCLKRVKIDCKK